MTRTANARIAGFTFLFYIAVAFPSMVLLKRATTGEGIAAKLATMAQHASDMRLALVLSFLGCLSAVVLAVTLYAVTRDQDREIALLGFSCRLAEGIVGAVTIPVTVALLALVTATGSAALDAAALQGLGAFVLGQDALIGELLFALGSTSFAWLFVRGRMIPSWLAWLGLLGSLLLVVELLLQLGGVVSGLATQIVWIPVAIFELTLGPWLLIKGVRIA